MDKSATENIVFGVENSFSGKRWVERPYNPQLAMAVSQQFDLPEIVGRLLTARGIDAMAVESFLNPRLSSMLPDPGHLLDMDTAV